MRWFKHPAKQVPGTTSAFQRQVAVGRWSLLFVINALILTSGCHLWSSPRPKTDGPSPGIRFAETRLTPGSAMMEVAVAQINGDVNDQFDAWFQQLDHQAVPLVRRRNWDANGLRIAVIPQSKIAELKEMLAPQPFDPSELPPGLPVLAGEGNGPTTSNFFLLEAQTFRDGEPRNLVVSPAWTVGSWSVVRDGQESSNHGENVCCSFDLTLKNHGSGNAHLHIQPRLKHGLKSNVTRSWAQAFQVDASQSETALDDLSLSLPLHLGQALIISSTPATTELGELFFGLPNANSEQRALAGRRILVVRLLQSQSDDVFGRSR